MIGITGPAGIPATLFLTRIVYGVVLKESLFYECCGR
jgi:hypothetical protein